MSGTREADVALSLAQNIMDPQSMENSREVRVLLQKAAHVHLKNVDIEYSP